MAETPLLVSIVTPSLNQGRFVEQAIQSVLEQDYPNIEHVVVDGGSTDETLEILRRYPHLRWTSEPDGGQTDALIKGFREANGALLAWLNADDFYLPGAVRTAVDALGAGGAGMVFGRCLHVDAAGAVLGVTELHEFDLRRELEWGTKVPQPATFFTREAYEASGGLDRRWSYAMDYDLWLKIAKRFPVREVDETLAAFRFHDASKTGSQADRFWPEVHRISRQHGAPYLSWKYLYFTSERRPRLGPWLYRLRFLRDRLSRGSP